MSATPQKAYGSQLCSGSSKPVSKKPLRCPSPSYQVHHHATSLAGSQACAPVRSALRCQSWTACLLASHGQLILQQLTRHPTSAASMGKCTVLKRGRLPCSAEISPCQKFPDGSHLTLPSVLLIRQLTDLFLILHPGHQISNGKRWKSPQGSMLAITYTASPLRPHLQRAPRLMHAANFCPMCLQLSCAGSLVGYPAGLQAAW